MSESRYIEVLLPVKLSWNPVYRVPANLSSQPPAVGDWVKVSLLGKVFSAVVTATGVTPEVAPDRVRDIIGPDSSLKPVTEKEIELWEFLADYYMCTAGEVLKCAYPSGKIRSESNAAKAAARSEAAARRRRDEAIKKIQARIIRLKDRIEARETSLKGRHNAQVASRIEAERDKLLSELKDAEQLLAEFPRSQVTDGDDGSMDAALPITREFPERHGISDLLDTGKPLLLRGIDRDPIYRSLEADYLSKGANVLHLVPEISFTSELEETLRCEFGDRLLVYHSHESETKRNEIADAIRTSGRENKKSYVILGTRSSIFLPFKNLGLIIIDEEQDRSYKQDSPAPRYNARDTSVMLARLHGADLILGSNTPSLETVYNCLTGKYNELCLNSDESGGDVLIIDTAIERKKRGMVGQFSRKLLEEVSRTLSKDGKVLLLRSWGDTEGTRDEISALFPDVRDGAISVSTISQARRSDIPEGSLVALLQADTLLGAPDFRADERAMQTFDNFRYRCNGSRFIIQTSRSKHILLNTAVTESPSARYGWLLSERQTFGYPPFSRIVDIIIRDSNEARISRMTQDLLNFLMSGFKEEMKIDGGMQISVIDTPAQIESRTIRVIIKRDRKLHERKSAVARMAGSFECSRNYQGHIHIDVDPN